MIMPAPTSRYLYDLQEQIDGLYSLEEVRDLCQSLGFDYENLPGNTRQALVRELIRRLLTQDRLQALVDLARAQRPAVAWADVPADLPFFTSDPFDEKQYRRLDYEPEMARIPAGPFLMGSDNHPPLEAPCHTVELPAFAIGVCPVTNEQFAHFINDMGRAAPLALMWNGNRPHDDQLDHPVTGVTWYEAMEYCQWLAQATGRPYTLPNEAQWEKAARGSDGRVFPWGDDWDPTRLNADRDVITAVRAFPPQSVYGCYDLVGNGREWTCSAWGLDPRVPNREYVYPWRPDRRNDPNLSPAIRRVFRGGRGVPGVPAVYRCSARGNYAPDQAGPRPNRHGFRVVLNP